MPRTRTKKTRDILRYRFIDFFLTQRVNESFIPNLFDVVDVIRAISRDFMEVRMSECILVLDDKYYQLQHIRSLPAAFGKTDD